MGSDAIGLLVGIKINDSDPIFRRVRWKSC